ncbi:hypothetical protein J4573_49840 [Actinomadura barringtoniae]|uniref:Uncharacterized protein n=1 Tax=Actinomadura barringtoniae TaxID=1427535 RepID=A0A939PS70_9ACTN|nr:hypothetical protein [Actinomadura barringtoniae]MBO2455264.1 hypothetical protein [Actinomadura barringtoniae]
MPKKIAIVLALCGCSLGAAACNDDGKSDAKGTPPPSASTTTSGTTPSAPTATAPSTVPSAPSPTKSPKDPKVTQSKQIVLIDPDGKRYTYTLMAQMAAGMRATMGKNPPSNFCAQSYREGLKGGGKYPAGRDAFMRACQEGWTKGGPYA